MAGNHKDLTSNNHNLEVKRAGKDWECGGTFVARGARPGRLRDVWMLGRSRRCQVQIPQGTLYVANRLLPSFIAGALSQYDRWLPLCLNCAMDTYSEFFEGPAKIKYLRPASPEQQKEAERGLVRLLHEATHWEVAS